MDPLNALDLRVRVDRRLARFLQEQTAVLGEVDPRCIPLLESVADLMRGGKRLRSAFCYWGHRAAGGPDGDSIVTASAALELFQAAALIHDDVMDASDTRRGQPAVHRRFEAMHMVQGWAGDAERFGVAGAVLAGDLCLGWADELFSGSGLPAEDLARGRLEFERMRTELMGGQYLDMFAQVSAADGDSPSDAEQLARRVLRFKSAKYSVQQPLLIGAALAGEVAGVDTAAVRAGFDHFGLCLGEAFQLRDDLLGVFGDADRTGKPAGDDLREGKRTVLVAATMGRAEPAARALVSSLLGRPDLDEDDVATVRGVMIECGARDYVEDLIGTLVDEVRAELAATPVVPQTRAVIEQLVDAATRRLM